MVSQPPEVLYCHKRSPVTCLCFSCCNPLYDSLFLRHTVLQESQIPYGYMMIDEQLWLAYVELQPGCMYLSDAISMRLQAGRPTVPMALLWLASQHTVKQKQLPRSGALPPFGPFTRLKAFLPSLFGQSRPPKQPVWRHVARPGRTYATPKETSHSYPLEFDPHSKPIGRGACSTVWQGLVYGQRAAVKVSHPNSLDAITELHTEAQFIQSTQSCKAAVLHACWGRAGLNLMMKRSLPTGWRHLWKALPSPTFSL